MTENKEIALATVAQQAEAYGLFLTGGRTPTQIAIQLSVDVDNVRLWIKKGGWIARRDMIQKEVFAVHEAEYRQLLIENKLPILRTQLEHAAKIGRMLEQYAEKKNGADMKAGEIKSLAEALSAYAAVQSKVVGMPDYVVSDKGVGSGPQRPMVAIINNSGSGGPVPSQQPNITVKEVIDVKEDGSVAQ